MAVMDSKPKIAFTPNGPYYLMHDMQATPVSNLRRASGEACATVRGVALCRCGASKNKPFCDGTHSAIGFSGRNTADPGKDKRESYAGKRITILDNRAICAHAGFCTDELKSVFRMREEPWIDPDGAGVKEIIATIRKCPSGALSYAIDGVEAGAPADDHRDRQRALRGHRRRRAHGREARARRLHGALHAVPLRRIEEQTVLRRLALGRGISRSGLSLLAE